MRISRVAIAHAGPFTEPFDLEIPEGKDPTRADTIILTGPNGSGKSTILYAIAACLGSGDEFDERIRSGKNSYAQIFLSGFGAGKNVSLPVAYWSKSVSDRNRPQLPHFESGMVRADGLNEILKLNGESAPALFAFGPLRTLRRQSKLEEHLERSPLDWATRFERPLEIDQLTSWILEASFKHLSARDEGDPMAEAYRASLDVLERALSDVIEMPFKFKVVREPILRVETNFGHDTVPLLQLPDGLKALVGWLGDLLRRLDLLRMQISGLPTELPFILLLDEIEVHLHPAWQRKLLPMVEKLFPNAQIFLSTHSPFIIGSATDSLVVQLDERGRVVETYGPQQGRRYSHIASEIMGITSDYDIDTEHEIAKFEALKADVLRKHATLPALEERARQLAAKSEDLGIALRFQIERVRELIKD